MPLEEETQSKEHGLVLMEGRIRFSMWSSRGGRGPEAPRERVSPTHSEDIVLAGKQRDFLIPKRASHSRNFSGLGLGMDAFWSDVFPTMDEDGRRTDHGVFAVRRRLCKVPDGPIIRQPV